MAALLAKFRIDFSSVLVIPGINHHSVHFHFLFDASSRCDEASERGISDEAECQTCGVACGHNP